jgi:uncharacterized protein
LNPRLPRLVEALIWVALAAALLVGLTWPPTAAPSVIDRAGLLNDSQRDHVTAYHGLLLEEHDIDYRVLTVGATPDVDRLAHERFAELDVGSASRSGRGLLLLIDPERDRVRLEVSAALEGVYTDAFVGYLEHRQMVPFFRAGRIADGILATSELIFARAQEAQAGYAFDPRQARAWSAGGGAATAARIAAGADTSFREGRADVAPQGSPGATVDAYMAAMRARNARPDLSLFSADSQAMLGSWTITPAQMDTLARTYAKCRGAEASFGADGDRAVIRYPIEQRRCAPWFLVREDAAWRLDLAASQRLLRFNHRNEWRLAGRADGYGFAFEDWRFDRNGFPIASD